MSTDRQRDIALGRKIAQARLATPRADGKRMTQADLAALIGVTEGTVGNYETGKTSAESALLAIEKALGRSIDPAQSVPVEISFKEALDRLGAAGLALAQANEIVRRLAEIHGNPHSL